MNQKILVHDYAGHPFQPQLSRALARRGYAVCHAYSKSLKGPQGALRLAPADPPTLEFKGIQLPSVLNKQALIERFFLERKYGRLVADYIERWRPDLVISSSAPLDSQVAILRASRKVGAKFVFWVQDLIGVATQKLLARKFLGAGTIIGHHYVRLEKHLLCQSDAVVSITDDFLQTLRAWGVPSGIVHVIPNWAALDEMPLRPKQNAWSIAQGLADKFCFIYTGTIGLKHNPEYLLQLALAYRDNPAVAVVVVSEGARADWLRNEGNRLRLSNLSVLPFQNYAVVPDVMATADVLVALLDPDAGMFSVPSKVLAYHCAGRALLVAVPRANLAARIVVDAKSGAVVEPGNITDFLAKAEELRAASQLREQMARNARNYAETMFDIERITDKFEALFARLLKSPPPDVHEEEVILADERA